LRAAPQPDAPPGDGGNMLKIFTILPVKSRMRARQSNISRRF
jgi:hypothetical protein